MKLYYSPVACSLADHIALRNADVDFEIERVNLATKLTAGGRHFGIVTPKGYVPALEPGTGEFLAHARMVIPGEQVNQGLSSLGLAFVIIKRPRRHPLGIDFIPPLIGECAASEWRIDHGKARYETGFVRRTYRLCHR
ncbi:hypothetical protein J2W42_003316 [Rhizobium tibeticum]|uniref:hypothetical protein n=1 Tax=Rhizobium tibeticum TaxID=501024 RepID=UPI002787D74B|nr:hypothetical protein [Rhizobium tibeticum]MDP9810455.1 hypothetical protein [Rhizobium tibeticum]